MYEITFITKEEKDLVVKKVIEDLPGKIISEQKLGRKKFAYPINKEGAGFYTTYIFETEGKRIKEIDKILRLKSEILRYLVVSKKAIKPEAAQIEVKEKEVRIQPEKVKKIKPVEKVKEKKRIEIPEKKPEKEKVGLVKMVKKFIKPKREAVEEKKEVVPEKVERPVEITKPLVRPAVEKVEEKELVGEEERLKELEKKLEEILKE